jgi:hypothetical protein
LAIQFEEHCD